MKLFVLTTDHTALLRILFLISYQNQMVTFTNKWTWVSPGNFKVHFDIGLRIAKCSCIPLKGGYLLYGRSQGKGLQCTFCRIYGQALPFTWNMSVAEWLLWFIKRVISIIEFRCGGLESLAYFILQHVTMESASLVLSDSVSGSMVRGHTCLSFAYTRPVGRDIRLLLI